MDAKYAVTALCERIGSSSRGACALVRDPPSFEPGQRTPPLRIRPLTHLKNKVLEQALVLLLVLGDTSQTAPGSLEEILEVLLARLEDLEPALVGLV